MFGCETLPAVLTRVGFLTSMNPLMFNHKAVITKTFSTLVTFEGFFSSVNPHMFNQVAALTKTRKTTEKGMITAIVLEGERSLWRQFISLRPYSGLFEYALWNRQQLQ